MNLGRAYYHEFGVSIRAFFSELVDSPAPSETAFLLVAVLSPSAPGVFFFLTTMDVRSLTAF